MDKKFIQLLRDGLESGKLLPSGLRAKLLDLKISSDKPAPDFAVEFNLDERKLVAVGEFKSRLTPSLLEGAIYQALKCARTLRVAEDRFRDIVPMVAAPYITETQRNRCKEVEVAYLDLNGTLFLRGRGFYVDVIRPATEFKYSQTVRNIFTGNSRRIIRTLLVKAHYPFRLDALAKEAKLSTARVFQVVRKLDGDRFIERTPEGRILVAPARLLRLFAEEVKNDYKQNRVIFTGFSELPPPKVASLLTEYCKTRGIEYGFTLSSGLEPHERNVREEITAAYIKADPAKAANDLRIDAVGRGANVFLMRAPEPDDTESGGVFYALRYLSNGLQGINPVQIYIDFALYSNRGQEQAEFMIGNVLDFRS
jgi:hypothetical protein